MNWFQKLFHKLFHKHKPKWHSREVIGKTSIDYTTGPVVDIQSATEYLVEGKCLECGEFLVDTYTIADIFDQPQPYDKVMLTASQDK